MIEVWNGNIEKAVREFKRECGRAGIIGSIKRREGSWKPSDRKKTKARLAEKRRKRMEKRTKAMRTTD